MIPDHHNILYVYITMFHGGENREWISEVIGFVYLYPRPLQCRNLRKTLRGTLPFIQLNQSKHSISTLTPWGVGYLLLQSLQWDITLCTVGYPWQEMADIALFFRKKCPDFTYRLQVYWINICILWYTKWLLVISRLPKCSLIVFMYNILPKVELQRWPSLCML